MGERIEHVSYNNPSLIPIGNYTIDIRETLMIELENESSRGKDKGNYHIVKKYDLDGKEIIYIDMVTLKKVLDMNKKYPKMDKDEVMTICQLRLSDNILEIYGDVVKVTDNIQ